MRTVSFYSYKGGVGRSLALVRLAKLLRSFGKSVVAVDLDFEAPGLHHKFGLQPDHVQSGVIEYLLQLKNDESATKSIKFSALSEPRQQADLGKGRVKIIPAGAVSSNPNKYLSALRELEPAHILSHKLGETWFRTLKEDIRDTLHPDCLLIDCRTGMSDIGYLGTMLLADETALFYLANDESVYGIQWMANRIRDFENQMNHTPTRLVPVLARVSSGFRPVDSPLERREGDWEERIADPVLLRSTPQIEADETVAYRGEDSLAEIGLQQDYFRLLAELGLDTMLSGFHQAYVRHIGYSEIGLRGVGQGSATPRESVVSRVTRRSNRALRYIRSRYFAGDTAFGQWGEEIARKLCEKLGVPKADVRADEARWELLPVHCYEGWFEFCDEPYFLTNSRKSLVDVVDFGRLNTLSVCMARESINKKVADMARSTDRDGLDEVFEALAGPNNSYTSSVGVLGETAASTEAISRSGDKAIKFSVFHDMKKLREWLCYEGEGCYDESRGSIGERIAVVDYGIALKLDRRDRSAEERECDGGAERAGYTSGSSLDAFTFNYSASVPVGFIFPANDAEWRTEISRAMIETLDDVKWATLEKDLESVGIEPIGLEEIFGYLLGNLPLDEVEPKYGKLREQGLIS